MRIKRVTVHPINYELKEPFVIALGRTTKESNVIVRIETSNGEIGWGNGAPNYVTRETQRNIVRSLKFIAKPLKGLDFSRVSEIHKIMDNTISHAPAAKAAIDMAIFDLLGKEAGLPLYRLLGAERDCIETDMTIGIGSLEYTVQKSKQYASQGFRVLKLKVGLDMKGDIDRINAVRDALPGIRLRIDGNQGYSVNEALQFANAIKELNIELIEQPVKADDYEGLAIVARRSPIPIMADESVKDLMDANRIAAMSAAQMINIKLMKCGGIWRGGMIDSIASKGCMPTMVGCMVESIVSIAAGVHFALSRPNVFTTDLDSHFYFKRDCSREGPQFEDGLIKPSNKAGLGVDVKLSKFRLPSLGYFKFL